MLTPERGHGLKSLGLISCTKRKQNYRCKASEMYSASDLFRKAFAYAVKNYDFAAILSAKYGLLFLDDEIEPYDLTLNKMRVKQRKEWAEKVFTQMNNRLDLRDFTRVFFHVGQKYRQYLIPKLEALGIQCQTPLEHIRFADQKAWYGEHDCEYGI